MYIFLYVKTFFYGIQWIFCVLWMSIFIRDLADSITPSVGPSVPRSKFFPQEISQLWDFIETWDFREDLKPIVLSPPMPHPPESTLCNHINSYFSALGLHRDLGFSRGPQAHSPFASNTPPLGVGDMQRYPQRFHAFQQ